jgi:hypothetical protein
MKKKKKQKSKEGCDHVPDSEEKSLEMIIEDSKTKAGAYRKILKSIQIKEKQNNL